MGWPVGRRRTGWLGTASDEQEDTVDRVRVELVGSLLIEAGRRRAERERLLIAVDQAILHERRTVARLGGLLIRLGGRLEAIGTRHPAPRPLLIATDPRGRCAR